METTSRFVFSTLLLALILVAGCESKGSSAYQGYIEGEFVYVAGKIAGRLDALDVARGDVVQAGRTLYVLEHAYETAGVALAEAEGSPSPRRLSLGKARAAAPICGLSPPAIHRHKSGPV